MRIAVAAMLLAVACPHPTPSAPPAEPTSTTAPAEPPPEPGPCPADAPDLEGLEWLPASTRAAIVIDLRDDAHDDALARLAELARSDGHGLPIDLAFSIGQWSWQVPSLAATLRQTGLEPGELLYVRGDEPSGAWFLTHRCDLDELRAFATDAWGLVWRTRVEGAVGHAPQGFAFDVIALTGGRLAFVAAGRADAWLAWLAGPGVGTPSDHLRIGPTIAALGPAPIRGVVAGPGLVDPAATDPPSSLALVATGQAVRVDASLPSPP